MQHSTVEEARLEYGSGYYAKKLRQGQEFQDHVTKWLYQKGVVIVNYGSKLFQQTEGENILGAEIKRDDNFRKTGNLYIEIAEKAHPDKAAYTKSGIYRPDNSWLFIIGDEATLWIFTTTILRGLHKSGKYRLVKTPTSQAFLLPLADADKYAGKRVNSCE